ncbi:TIGR03943 family putative permease subunit [Actinomadura madurae]|uniref:TIGR03943 family putative permease subunit n=1 Tax=Actinomadura madurae TaxID=1993 RepID=UPI0020D1FC6E|nr:TIGR03943 family protein [Actinomadura madurae]MCP9952564.1 TIGR03943 family protein [Actinomadura madurae]MCP9981796.1 TIGR03943 family protein [Actinomadura madurae]MCQ0018010.1 TIGR03943 family protein [Actinomadura madurae]
MSKSAQNLLLVLIGAAMLWITLGSGEYVNYVRPGFRYPLVIAAAALLVLGAAGLRREWRDTGGSHDDHDGDGSHDDGHGHAGGPRVAWLLCLPVLAIFVIAPPALGSFTATRNTGRTAPPPAPSGGFAALPSSGEPVPMKMGEFIGRAYQAQTGDPATFTGVPVRLTGFVTPAGKGARGWQLTRLKVACCAGDAIPFPVMVRGLPRPPADAWVQVDGVWEPPATGQEATVVQTLRGRSLKRIKKPANPYE